MGGSRAGSPGWRPRRWRPASGSSTSSTSGPASWQTRRGPAGAGA